MKYRIKITDVQEATIEVESTSEKTAIFHAKLEFNNRRSQGPYDGRPDVINIIRNIEVLKDGA